MTHPQQRLLIIFGGVVTLLLIWFAPPDEVSAPVSEPVRREHSDARRPLAPARTVQKSAPASEASVAVTPARELIPQGHQLFRAGSWMQVAPAPKMLAPPPPPAPEKPVAPPLPFSYLGQYVEDGEVQVLLAFGNRVVTAHMNEIIEASYKVVRIDAATITFLYLPLQQTQTLAIGGAP